MLIWHSMWEIQIGSKLRDNAYSLMKLRDPYRSKVPLKLKEQQRKALIQFYSKEIQKISINSLFIIDPMGSWTSASNVLTIYQQKSFCLN